MSGPSSPPPQAYQPAGQGQADAATQAAAGQLTGLAQQLPGQVLPGYQSIYTNVQNNPYYPGAQLGANQVAQQSQYTANQLMGAGGQAYGMANQAPTAFNAALPGAQAAPNVLKSGLQLAPQLLGMNLGAIPGLTGQLGSAYQALNTAFDPQSALFNQLTNLTQQEAGASNAMSGLSGGVAAGNVNDALRNFNIDWENQQLGRETQGLQAFDSSAANIANTIAQLTGAGTGAYGSMVGTGVGAYDQLLQALNAGQSTSANTLSQLLGTGADLSGQSLRTLTEGSQLPSSTFTGNENSILAALNAMNQGYGQSLNPLTQAINAQDAYLQLGQGATSLDQNAWQMQQQANAQAMGGLGSLFGDALGLIGAPFTGGASLGLTGLASLGNTGMFR